MLKILRLAKFYYKIIVGREQMKIKAQETSETLLKFCLEIHFYLDPVSRFNINITGWALGHGEIYKLIYSSKENSFEIPVCLPRPDVYELINSNHKYPFGNAFFSGISTRKILMLDSTDTQKNLHHNLDFIDRNRKVMSSISFVLIPNEKIILSV